MQDVASVLSSCRVWLLVLFAVIGSTGIALLGSAYNGFLALHNGDSPLLSGFFAWPQRLTMVVWGRLRTQEAAQQMVGTYRYWRLVAATSGVLGGLAAGGGTLILRSGRDLPIQYGQPSPLASPTFLGASSLIIGLQAWFTGNQILTRFSKQMNDGPDYGGRKDGKTVAAIAHRYWMCGMLSAYGTIEMIYVVVSYLSGVSR